ncbi:MAG TPA: hypothetical protein VIK13_06400, partial [Candidatus Limnocylindrales bacterium]
MPVIEGGRLPVWSWATDAEGVTLEQARNLADLEVARDHVAVMPDAHAGFGMPNRWRAVHGRRGGALRRGRGECRGVDSQPANPVSRLRWRCSSQRIDGR